MNQFSVEVLSFDELKKIGNSRPIEDFDAILEQMEYGDAASLSESEKIDLVHMYLQDMDPRDAANFVLTRDMSDVLTAGQIDNISLTMLDEKIWEEYSDMSLHERLFRVASLLYQAAPRSFPETDAVRVHLRVKACNAQAEETLSTPLSKSFAMRLLADGLDKTTKIHRLFSEQLNGTIFPEADKIAWSFSSTKLNEKEFEITVTSSGCWLNALRDTESYSSKAYGDD